MTKCCFFFFEYRCVHPDSSWSCDDAGGIPWMLRCHSGISVSTGNGEHFKIWRRHKFLFSHNVLYVFDGFFFDSSSSFWWSSLPVKWPQLSGVSWTKTLCVNENTHTHTHSSLIIDVFASVPVNASVSPIIRRFPKNSSIFTTPLTSRLWMCQTPPVKTRPPKSSTFSTMQYVKAKSFFSSQKKRFIWKQIEWRLASAPGCLQLDCCGKGNDTLLFQNVAASLCSENTRNKPEKDKVWRHFTSQSSQ